MLLSIGIFDNFQNLLFECMKSPGTGIKVVPGYPGILPEYGCPSLDTVVFIVSCTHPCTFLTNGPDTSGAICFSRLSQQQSEKLLILAFGPTHHPPHFLHACALIRNDVTFE